MVNAESEVAAGHRLRLEIDGDGDPGLLGGEVEQRADLVLRQRHREQPAAERVGPEDVSERLGDDGADAVIGKRPHRMLARRAAAEVAPGDHHGARPRTRPG